MFGMKSKSVSKKKQAFAGIEQLVPGQSLIYRLAEVYHSGMGEFAVIERNQDVPGNGKKFVISTDKEENGSPKGQRIRRWDTNKTKDIVVWLKDKNATPFN